MIARQLKAGRGRVLRAVTLAVACLGISGCHLFSSEAEKSHQDGLFQPSKSQDDAIRRAAAKHPFVAGDDAIGTQPASPGGN